MFKVYPASLQTFIDTPNCVLEDRVQYSTVRIPNVFCDGHLKIINCVGIVRIPSHPRGAQRLFDRPVFYYRSSPLSFSLSPMPSIPLLLFHLCIFVFHSDSDISLLTSNINH
jgi:hypothetical protein